MPPYSLLTTTIIQSTFLNALSNLLAQIIDQYKNNKPFAFNFIYLLQFITYGILIVPINMSWQRWLEVTFPGFLFASSTTPAPKKSSTAATLTTGTLPVSVSIPISTNASPSGDVLEVKDKLIMPKFQPKAASAGRGRRIFNFAMKFFLDQTAGGILNIFLFVALINLLKGASVGRTWELVLEDFKPIMLARLKYRPFVSTLMYTVIPLDRRVVFGSACGVIWGVYLSLYAAV
ncbi:hypothetical protein BJY04DRAFT_202995 [Aspergillus karnatakaensis]|uniref:uncharacterized protein n=1 Tax=Aspergillus karnatakaensis TaxID=1810916 RepID=UPI003CCCEDDA